MQNQREGTRIMGLLQRLFSNSSKKQPEFAAPTTFLECLAIVQNWSAKIAIDPDFDLNDKNLQTALDTMVTCPYCSTNIKFGSAVTFQKSRLQVQCPVCHTVPRKEKEYEYGRV